MCVQTMSDISDLRLLNFYNCSLSGFPPKKTNLKCLQIKSIDSLSIFLLLFVYFFVYLLCLLISYSFYLILHHNKSPQSLILNTNPKLSTKVSVGHAEDQATVKEMTELPGHRNAQHGHLLAVNAK